MSMDIALYLTLQLKQHSISANEQQIHQLIQYISLLQLWNKAYNLIANDEPQHIVDRHIIDSLLVLPYIKGKTIIDVGAGAGLPGIPLAILLPDHHVTLLDSNGKKTRFMTQVKIELGLNNIAIVNERVENYHPDHLFDVVTSRAFAELSEMLTLTQHLCAPQGEFIALKGDEAEKETAQLPDGFSVKTLERLPFVDKTINRKVIVVKNTH